MEAIRLSLIVLRAANPGVLADFYANLGITFVTHQHGSGPEHCSAELNFGVVFEIYPLKPGQPPTTSTRLGFSVESVTAACGALCAAGGKMVSEPKVSEWGLRAVLADPAGHRIELTERKVDADGSSACQSE